MIRKLIAAALLASTAPVAAAQAPAAAPAQAPAAAPAAAAAPDPARLAPARRLVDAAMRVVLGYVIGDRALALAIDEPLHLVGAPIHRVLVRLRLINAVEEHGHIGITAIVVPVERAVGPAIDDLNDVDLRPRPLVIARPQEHRGSLHIGAHIGGDLVVAVAIARVCAARALHGARIPFQGQLTATGLDTVAVPCVMKRSDTAVEAFIKVSQCSGPNHWRGKKR